MPFGEALFWFGITAFGTGLYFLCEDTVKRLYSIGLMVVGALACGYSVYRHDHPEFPAIHLWIILLILTWAFVCYAVYLSRVRRLLPAPEKPKEPSKLVIHSANYRAVDVGSHVYEVSEFLRKIIFGNSLVFDIENHNFVIDGTNFVPTDPRPFKVKRLQVVYSYADGPVSTIERYEHDRLVLPEDSAIRRLTDEIGQLRQGNPSLSSLQKDALQLSVELLEFLKRLGPPPAPKYTEKEIYNMPASQTKEC